MSDSLKVAMLPAKEGDCLVVSYGNDSNKKHILIDAGRVWTYQNALKSYLTDNGLNDLELLVVTHIDRDHIDGMLKLIRDTNLNLNVKNCWFNTWDHLHGRKIAPPQTDIALEEFGAKMGEELSSEIITKEWNWNSQFDGGAVELDNNPIKNEILFDDFKLTLLSPDRTKLEALIPTWKVECKTAGITPGSSVQEYVIDNELEILGTIDIERLASEKFEEDSSKANGSSIAFILEYKNRRILLSGDAHSDLLVKSLRSLGASETNPLKLDAFKLPHHGSKYNISKELLGIINCDHYLVSTNGNYFNHPEQVAMARLIKFGTINSTINFNYRTEETEIWENADWEKTYKYKTNYPDYGNNGYLHLEFSI
ncbi:MAG TPA: hypothetical protein VIL74_07255 [Pyrinomonadaceae bacterium]|jgi:metal-dependent hydrolase (beta-lactamase superfamily II)